MPNHFLPNYIYILCHMTPLRWWLSLMTYKERILIRCIFMHVTLSHVFSLNVLFMFTFNITLFKLFSLFFIFRKPSRYKNSIKTCLLNDFSYMGKWVFFRLLVWKSIYVNVNFVVYYYKVKNCSSENPIMCLFEKS